MKFPSFRSPIFALTALGAISPIAVAQTASDSAATLTNAQGTLRFSLQMKAGAPRYSVNYLNGALVTPVIEDSPLGLTRTDADFTTGIALVSATAPKVVKDDYKLVIGKVSRVQTQGLERTFTLKNALNMPITLTVRAYRDGIAFRYGLPGKSSNMFQISGEATGFNVPDESKIWSQPYSKVDKWAPGYESEYVNGVPAGTAASGPEGWSLPLLFKSEKLWGLVTETGLDSTYFGSHLQPDAPAGLYRVRLPEVPETYGVAPQNAAVMLPWLSPWRLVIVGQKAGDVTDSTLVTDLAAPSEIKDTSWIKPGMASWSWWSDGGSPYSYAKLTPYVDVAAKMGWPYSLIDLGWDKMGGGNIQQLIDYAAKKNVSLILWYNSAGKHNELRDGTNLDLMVDPMVRDAEFARIAKMGVKGVKIDFMQSDKQYIIALYHDILRDAARHHLMVDFHGSTIPRGWERTHPNLVSMEGVRGAEQYWDKNFAENAQMFHTIYPFTRNAIGPMDYTPTVFTDPGASNPQVQPHLTTHGHELALSVVFFSGIQHIIDPAASLMAQPAYVQQYLTRMPTTWDESRVLMGAPGELAVIARRAGKVWYLAGINGEKTPKTIRVPLAFLGKTPATMSLITDGATGKEFAHTTRTANASDVVTINLLGRGGFAALLK